MLLIEKSLLSSGRVEAGIVLLKQLGGATCCCKNGTSTGRSTSPRYRRPLGFPPKQCNDIDTQACSNNMEMSVELFTKPNLHVTIINELLLLVQFENRYQTVTAVFNI